jgi:hypothetical protein
MRQLLTFAVCFATLQLVVSKTNGFDCSTACDNSIRNSWDGTICDVTPASTDWLGWKPCSDNSQGGEIPLTSCYDWCENSHFDWCENSHLKIPGCDGSCTATSGCGASSGTCKSKYKCVDKIGADGNHWSGSVFRASVGVTCRSELREQGKQNADSNTVPPAALTACLLP